MHMGRLLKTCKNSISQASEVPVKKEEWPHTEATTLKGLSPLGRPPIAGQVSTRQMPVESILLWDKPSSQECEE